MHYVTVESGCWQLKTDDGETFELVGEDITSLFKEGLRVELIVRQMQNMASICMVGKIVELVEVVRIIE